MPKIQERREIVELKVPNRLSFQNFFEEKNLNELLIFGQKELAHSGVVYLLLFPDEDESM